MALTTSKAFLIEISRRLTGQRARTRWGPRHILSAATKLCQRWLEHIRSFAKDDDQLTYLMALIPHGPAYWISHPSAITPHRIHQEIKALGKLLHGRHRKDLRHLLSRKALYRRLLRKSGRHLSETKLMLDRSPPFFALDETLQPDGTITTDQRTISRLATDFFRDWHAPKPHLTYGFHDPKIASSRLLSDLHYFTHTYAPTGVPAHLLRLLWLSLNKPLPSSPDFIDDQRALSSTPSLEDYLQALRATPSRSAPGPSGCTYNMLAALPLPILTAAYEHTRLLWIHREGCPFWKWRLLTPLPKVLYSSNLNDIRPITLIETTRKVWAGIIVARIQSFWSKWGLLHPSQHAYQAHRGVHTVLPQHISALEEAAETCSSSPPGTSSELSTVLTKPFSDSHGAA